MARRSAIGDASEAFELFLDTITNTFGGVVFISLLVCILLQIRGAPAETNAEADMARARAVETDLLAVKAEVARLEELQRRVTGQAVATSQQSDPRLVAEFERLTKEKEKEEAEIRRLEAEEPLRKQKAADLQTKLAALQSEQTQLRKQVTQLEGDLKEVRNRGSHRIRLPRYRPTVKQQIPLTVFDQHVCFPYEYDGSGNATAKNEADFGLKPSLGGDTIMIPKAGHGTRITKDDAFRAELKRRLAQFDKETTYVHLAVWPDSYAACEIVRDVLVDMGFGYGLLLMNSDGPLVLSSTGQRGEM